MRALLLLFLTIFLTACGTERVVEKPVVVEVPGPVEYVPVPGDLLIRHIKTTVPESLTYGEALQLWAEDRAIIDTQNGQLAAIEVLNNGDTPETH